MLWLYSDILHVNNVDRFNVDLSLTFLYFQIDRDSNVGILCLEYVFLFEIYLHFASS